jgi:enamine deaminase RidA (YjgF/YER057c/UK114 family)
MNASADPNLSEHTLHGIEACCLEREMMNEVFATVLREPGEDARSVLARTGRMLREFEAEVIRMHVFGATDSYPAFRDAMIAEVGEIDWPLTYVQGNDCYGAALAGIQLHALSGTTVDTIRQNGEPVGRVFEDRHARYCYLGDLRSADTALPRTEQGRESFVQLEEGLAHAGMELQDLVRTWLFIDDILDWYGEFNRMRDEFFAEKGMFDRFLPSSTGIGGANPQGAAVAACAVALQPVGEGVTVQEVLSPLQCPAHDYGSSFSRAAEIATPDYRCVLVSGTASIEPEGETVHVGDTEAQIDLTLRVVNEILKSRGLDFSKTTRANAYFKHQNDAATFGKFCAEFGIPARRVVISHDDVCRDDLLFEIELDAINVGR